MREEKMPGGGIDQEQTPDKKVGFFTISGDALGDIKINAVQGEDNAVEIDYTNRPVNITVTKDFEIIVNKTNSGPEIIIDKVAIDFKWTGTDRAKFSPLNFDQLIEMQDRHNQKFMDKIQKLVALKNKIQSNNEASDEMMDIQNQIIKTNKKREEEQQTFNGYIRRAIELGLFAV